MLLKLLPRRSRIFRCKYRTPQVQLCRWSIWQHIWVLHYCKSRSFAPNLIQVLKWIMIPTERNNELKKASFRKLNKSAVCFDQFFLSNHYMTSHLPCYVEKFFKHCSKWGTCKLRPFYESENLMIPISSITEETGDQKWFPKMRATFSMIIQHLYK